MGLHTRTIVAALAFCAGVAQASTITIGTGASSAGLQVGADAYKSVVSGAITKWVDVSSFDNVSTASLGLATRNYAFAAIVDFGVTASQAGLWSFRTGVDFGKGGALFIDGVGYDSESGDMWWNKSYNASTENLSASLNLAAGNHTLAIYGLEDCCSGAQQAQFKYGSTAFTSFSSTDGLNPVSAVPEPESYAMLLTSLGLMAAIARRRQNGQ